MARSQQGWWFQAESGATHLPCTNPATWLGGWNAYFPPLCLSVFIYKMESHGYHQDIKSLETLRVHSKCHIPLGWSCLHPAVSFRMTCTSETLWIDFYSLLLRASLTLFEIPWEYSTETSFATFPGLTLKMLVYVSIFNSFLESAGHC